MKVNSRTSQFVLVSWHPKSYSSSDDEYDRTDCSDSFPLENTVILAKKCLRADTSDFDVLVYSLKRKQFSLAEPVTPIQGRPVSSR